MYGGVIEQFFPFLKCILRACSLRLLLNVGEIVLDGRSNLKGRVENL